MPMSGVFDWLFRPSDVVEYDFSLPYPERPGYQKG